MTTITPKGGAGTEMRKNIVIAAILILVIAGAVLLLFGKKAKDKDNLEPAIESERVAAERSGATENNLEISM